jgi:hypothetical protein
MGNKQIHSSNDWLVKAGAKYEQGRLELPIKSLLAPMTLASESIVSFRNSTNLNDRIKHGIVVVSMVRTADTAYFTKVAKMIAERNNRILILCQHCIRGKLWPTKIKKYRRLANQNIIHKMEKGLPINNNDLKVVELYYEEMFKHPLMNPISWGRQSGMKMCPDCLKKNNKRRNLTSNHKRLTFS